MTIIVAVMGNKGGISKSTLVRNLADGCAREGLKTIAVDADSQHTLTYTMQVQPVDGFMTLMTDDRVEWSDVLVPVPATFSGCQHEYLYILPTYEGQAQIESQPGLVDNIYDRFKELQGYVDVVLVDTSPGRSNVHAGFYQVADYVLLPCQPELESIMGLTATLNHLYTIGQSAPVGTVMGIVPNQFNGNQTVHQNNYNFLLEHYGSRYTLFKPIRDMAIWRDAAQKRQSIYALADQKDYRPKAKQAIGELQPILDTIVKAARA